MPERSEYVYRNRLTQGLASGLMALCAGIGLAIALDPAGPPYLGGLVAAMGGYLGWLAGWQSSVRLNADGVTVSNMFLVGFVPWDLFSEFRVRNGLKVVMTDGRAIGSFAFGGSLAGQFSGFRRMRRIVDQMEADRQSLAAGAVSSGQPVRTRERHSYRPRVHFDLWPLVALVVPLEIVGLLTAIFR
ncbi:MAG TPA: hypothetical protein VNF47_03965 [Streptosporangiaceae bacterium]|nr:hypothetical protein [Streptosporangiaceae bacterium]